MATNVCIMGGGNGAFAAAADLSLRGYRVTIYENECFKSNVFDIMETGIIHCVGVGPVGDAKIYKVTCDLADALSDVDVIMPIAPAYAQEDMAKALLPYIKSGDKIVLTPGSTGGALIFAKVLHDNGKLDGVKIAEMHTLPYATRKVDSCTVNIILMCKMIFFAAFPAIELVTDVLETSLNNGNAVSHPAPVVLNAGKIEYYGKHYHYKEGITPSVAKVNEKIDEERLAIASVFRYTPVNARERLYRMGYCPMKNTLYESYQGSIDVFIPIEGPDDLGSRYLTEDAPCSLVAMAEIAKLVGVATPVMDSIKVLASTLRSENFWTTGRTLEKMGLNGMAVDEIKELVQRGYK
ncbi:NAD/NADP octopine/nopaline dehydrogenase family protein [Clostridium bowmanii]|uniref:NAD/NADP octopine/nopaline dehydrogenase family protein n=1 Tax=Clostridium bowmanii TaxID=132925 RepID=UPI001C0B8736|nr:NAD/NADP octopine/nopaline dehydrogenase family protein [Clostridium bowmanii]MBU3189932.1 NAD/NADP octopine/nopaline dehydrogenase family protein [Clostridium bowmanii]MCA1074634.1 NAD/NADP octopine/nopaline dehydrogenase family protein [Clostridium bowmanii]